MWGISEALRFFVYWIFSSSSMVGCSMKMCHNWCKWDKCPPYSPILFMSVGWGAPTPCGPCTLVSGPSKGGPSSFDLLHGCRKTFLPYTVPSKPRCLPTTCAEKTKWVTLSTGPCPKSNCTTLVLWAYRALGCLMEQRRLLVLQAAALLTLQSCFLLGPI